MRLSAYEQSALPTELQAPLVGAVGQFVPRNTDTAVQYFEHGTIVVIVAAGPAGGAATKETPQTRKELRR